MASTLYWAAWQQSPWRCSTATRVHCSLAWAATCWCCSARSGCEQSPEMLPRDRVHLRAAQPAFLQVLDAIDALERMLRRLIPTARNRQLEPLLQPADVG